MTGRAAYDDPGAAQDEPEVTPPQPLPPDGAIAGVRVPRGVCPHLEVAGARWRHAAPSRDHRCLALVPAAPLTADKQRRLCLGAAHVTCPSYLAAIEARRAWLAPNEAGSFGPAPARGRLVELDANRWAIGRIAPVVGGVATGTRPLELMRHRAVAQVGLVGLLALAFVAIAVSRGPGDGSSGALLVPTPTPTVAPTERPTPTPTLVPAPASSAPPAATPSPTQPPSSPTPAVTTYKVVSGDTLSGIAGRFRTTVKAIMDLNALTTTTLRVGQQLLIPPPAGAPAAPSTPAATPAGAG